MFSGKYCEILKNTFSYRAPPVAASELKVIYNINPLSAKFIKWSNTLKQIVGKLPTICLSVFDHFSGLAFKGLKQNVIFLI